MQAKAWLLDVGMDTVAAVGARSVVHLLDVPVTYPVPYTPSYCCRVVSWQGRLLPIMDIARRLGVDGRDTRYVAIVGYPGGKDGDAQYGAVPLVSPPRQVVVSDEQACDLPENLQEMRGMAISCFEMDGQAVPVLNLMRLFGSLAGSN
jgi:chemotaxis signal transduction protein